MSNKGLKFKPGVLYGEDVKALFDYANKNNFAIPAVNVVGTNSVNAVLETAREVNSPVIIQFSMVELFSLQGRGLPMKITKLPLQGVYQERNMCILWLNIITFR